MRGLWESVLNSDYIVFVDESGDHSLTKIDPQYPVFVLAFCVLPFTAYSERVAPAMRALKFKHFGHDCVVLHDHDIRKRRGPFSAMPPEEREAFALELRRIIGDADLTIIAAAIHKERLSSKYKFPSHPYHLGAMFGLERLHGFLLDRGQADRLTHVICEARGSQEDRDLELEFRRVCDGANQWQQRLPFDIKIVHKQANSEGLQLADLVARPIGLQVLRPDQPNRMWETLRGKLRTGPNDRYEGYGFKVFP